MGLENTEHLVPLGHFTDDRIPNATVDLYTYFIGEASLVQTTLISPTKSGDLRGLAGGRLCVNYDFEPKLSRPHVMDLRHIQQSEQLV